MLHVEMHKSRFMTAYFNLENEYNAVLSARYVEKRQFFSFPGAVNTVGDTVQRFLPGGALRRLSDFAGAPPPRAAGSIRSVHFGAAWTNRFDSPARGFRRTARRYSEGLMVQWFLKDRLKA